MLPIDRKEYISYLAELDEYKIEIAELIEAKDYQRYFEATELEVDYLNKVGRLENDIFRLEYKVRRLKRKIEIVGMYDLKSGPVNFYAVESLLDHEFEEVEIELESRDRKERKLFFMQDEPQMNDEEMDDFTDVYRSLIKKMHPALNPNGGKENAFLWQEAKVAYMDRNIDRLLELDEMEDRMFEIVPDIEEEIEIIEQIEDYREIAYQLRESIVSRSKTFPFKYRERLLDANWVNLKNDINASVLEQLRKIYEEQSKTFDALMQQP